MSAAPVQTNGSGPETAERSGPPPSDPVAQFLGWFSAGLGVPQLAAPGKVNQIAGIEDDRESRFWQRVVGVREMAAWAGIITRPRPAAWLWARVGGDVMDLALLGTAFRSKAARRGRLGATIMAITGVTALDLLDALGNTRKPGEIAEDGSFKVKTAITVRSTPDAVYGFWRGLENLPRFMAHVESVETAGDRRSHWTVNGPAGRTVEWDAETVEDRPNQLIAWRSLPGSLVKHSGRVRFVPAPGDRGTEVHLDMRYSPPGGPAAAGLARLFGEEPEQQAKDDLRRFKQVMETGEVVRSEGSPEGIFSRRLMKQRPAQPLERSSS